MVQSYATYHQLSNCSVYLLRRHLSTLPGYLIHDVVDTKGRTYLFALRNNNGGDWLAWDGKRTKQLDADNIVQYKPDTPSKEDL